jgi:hypothetical protein
MIDNKGEAAMSGPLDIGARGTVIGVRRVPPGVRVGQQGVNVAGLITAEMSALSASGELKLFLN